jgi:cytochrome c peroxidase
MSSAENASKTPASACLVGFAGSLAMLALSGCQSLCGDAECVFSETEWKQVETLSPLPDPALDPTNRYDGNSAAVELGQMLFFETRYSNGLKVASYLGNVGDKQKVSCAACHDPNGGFSDTKSMPNNMSVGVSWTTRNTPGLINTVYYGRAHAWDLRQDSLWNQGSTTPETGTNSAGDRCQYARMLFTHYRERYDSLFVDSPLPEELDPLHVDAKRFPAACKPSTDPAKPGAWEMMSKEDRAIINRIMANQGKAVAAYEAKLVSRNAPFDRYVGGDHTAISDPAKRGLKLFVGKAACNDCHKGPFFTDFEAHNLGLAQIGPNVPTEDLGVFSGFPQLRRNTFNAAGDFSDNVEIGMAHLSTLPTEMPETEKGKFRTATLRNVAQTAPYMHTGALPTLRAVVEYYNKGGERGNPGVKDRKIEELGLSDTEIDDLVSFLETLTGEAVPAPLRVNPHQ